MNALSLAVFAVALAVASAGLLTHAPLAHVVAAPALAHSHSAVVSTSLHQTHPSPAVIAHAAAPVAVVAPVVVAAGHGIVGHGLAGLGLGYGHGLGLGFGLAHGHETYPILTPGSGLEGQWVPDHNEKFYDDGSYKGEIYHHLHH